MNNLDESTKRQRAAAVEPSRLELTLVPTDGSLATAPLSSVIVAATDALYTDLWDMTNGEIEVTQTTASAAAASTSTAGGGGTTNEQEQQQQSASDEIPTAAPVPTGGASGDYAATLAAAVQSNASKEKMTSLSFAQRRHELASRIARHGRSLGHVAALVADYGYNQQSKQAHATRGRGSSANRIPAPGELSAIVSLSSRTFRHVRQAWVQADEAQDALYFHHDQLWKARRHVHDVRGALGVVCGGERGERAGVGGGDAAEAEAAAANAAASASLLGGGGGNWYDFPTDASLQVDRYETSPYRYMSKAETLERLRGCVRRKLVLGEVGCLKARKAEAWAAKAALAAAANEVGVAGANGGRRDEAHNSDRSLPQLLPWRIVLERNGGAVRLTYGEPRSLVGVDARGGDNESTSSSAAAPTYPIEARLTVLSESDGRAAESSDGGRASSSSEASAEAASEAEWTLLSVRTSVSAKVGESDHQLTNLTSRQMFDLHRLCVRAMTVEEAQARKANELLAKESKQTEEEGDDGVESSLGQNGVIKKEEAGQERSDQNGGGGGTVPMVIDGPMPLSSSSSALPVDMTKRQPNGGVASRDSPPASSPPTSALLRGNDGRTVIARPLSCLFDVVHSFAVSLQLEVLSAQALALSKGSWAGCIAVSPVHFFDRTVGDAFGDGSSGGAGGDGGKGAGKGAGGGSSIGGRRADRGGDDEEGEAPLAVMAIHFWSVDDRHGHPALGDLTESSSSSTSSSSTSAIPPLHASSAPTTDAASVASSSVRSKKTTASSSRTTERHLPPMDGRGSGRLTLSLRAMAGRGVIASISGGGGVTAALVDAGGTGNIGSGSGSRGGDKDGAKVGDGNASTVGAQHRHLRRNVAKLLSATSSPFRLSASDALLAATVLCAERRCEAVSSALIGRDRRGGGGVVPSLPTWIDLQVECGTISVGAKISYFGKAEDVDDDAEKKNYDDGNSAAGAGGKSSFVELFRLACDSRTGRFVPTFPRAASLLRSLACNDVRASELQMLRVAALSSRNVSSAKRRSAASGGDLTGRAVREAFDGLARSADVLGRRAGVGGAWVDADDRTSSSLRDRAIDLACGDVRSSLMACAGMAAVYGVSALALGVCSGVDAAADMAGGPIVEQPLPRSQEKSGSTAGNALAPPPLLPIPPMSIVMNQQMVEKKEVGGDGEEKAVALLEREVFAISASVVDDALTVQCFDVTTQMESPSLPPTRISCTRAPLPASNKEDSTTNPPSVEEGRPTKRPRIEKSSSYGPAASPLGRHRQMLDEVQCLAARFENALY